MRWLRFHLLTFFRRQRYRARGWLNAHPRVTAFLERSGSLHVDEDALARGVAMGLFIGLTPTVGIQTALMLTGAMLFRANFVAAYIFSFVSNPFTMGPLYYGFHELGEWFIALLPISTSPPNFPGADMADDAVAMLLGSMLVAAPIAVVGYLVAYRLWRIRERKRLARRQQSLQYENPPEQ